MVSLDDIKLVIGDVLQLGDRMAGFGPETALLGSIPEFDSMAVVSVLTSIEDSFGVTIDDDEINAEIFETLGTLAAFVDQKISG